MKGQFMLISALIGGLLIISLSTTVSNIQQQKYHSTDLPEHINLLRDEAQRITDPSSAGSTDITEKEKINFRKMTNYIDSYRTKVRFNETADCVAVTLTGAQEKIDLPCMN